MPLFKRKKQEPKPDLHQTVEKMNGTLDTINKKTNELETQIANDNAKIKKYLNEGNRTQAAATLRHRKILEQNLKLMQGSQFRMEQQVAAISNVDMTKTVLDTLVEANAATKAAYEGMNVDDVADVMDDIRDQMDQMDEMNEILSQPFPGFEDIDADLDDELDQLEALELDKQMLGTSEPVPTQPTQAAQDPVPDKPATKTDEEALNDLNGLF